MPLAPSQSTLHRQQSRDRLDEQAGDFTFELSDLTLDVGERTRRNVLVEVPRNRDLVADLNLRIVGNDGVALVKLDACDPGVGHMSVNLALEVRRYVLL